MSPALFDKSNDMNMSPLLAGSTLIVLAYIITAILSRSRKLHFPVVGNPKAAHWEEALLEGTAKYPNTPYILPSDPPMVILPHSTVDEVRSLPENKVSFQKEIERLFISAHTKFGKDAPVIVKTVKSDLTRHAASTVGALEEELHYALNREIGTGESWTRVVLLKKVIRIVALVSGRVFVGRPLSRNEEWLQTSIQYTTDCVKARDAAAKWPAWTRHFVSPFLPEIRMVQAHTEKAAELLKPVINGCIRRFKEGKRRGGESGDEFEFDEDQGTFVSWIMKHTTPELKENPYNLAVNQLTLSFASIHTTTMAVCHTLLDLAAHPEFIEPLREEIEQVIAEDGYEVDDRGNKCMKKQSMVKLRKLDSLLKESQRVNPPRLTANVRITTDDIHLSTGDTIPKGTRIGYDALALNLTGPDTSSLSHGTLPQLDPTNVFSPFRYASLRETPGNESKYQFVTTSKESMNFGHGSHACPGRFFAGIEIKVIMVELLRNWEFRNVGDIERKGGGRPKNWIVDTAVSPNFGAELEIKRRG